MRWPAIVIDNFFNNFKDVEKFAHSLEYTHSGNGNYPGYRSKQVHEIDYDFFSFTCTKMLQALYPMNYMDIVYNARMFFQTIPFEGKGFIHQDDNEISSIIYIRGSEAGGTSLFEPKRYPFDRNSYIKHKEKSFEKEGKINNLKNYEKHLKQHNSQFKTKLKVNFKPNRLFMFDCNEFHEADSFGGDRLTLVTFFESIRMENNTTLRSHVTEAKKWG
tara:strand:+ start:127 stop:777 length:651 start_codon:yes stop_codon:yes gene_type:complete